MIRIIRDRIGSIMMLTKIVYLWNAGIYTPSRSAIFFTMMFGALPIYVNAPKNTVDMESAISSSLSDVISTLASPPAA